MGEQNAFPLSFHADWYKIVSPSHTTSKKLFHFLPCNKQEVKLKGQLHDIWHFLHNQLFFYTVQQEMGHNHLLIFNLDST